MQWENRMNAGFSEADPWIEVPDNYKEINVEAEKKDQDSILEFYKELIRLRKERRVISDGRIEFLCQEDENILAYRRCLEVEEILVFCNFRGKHVTIGVDLDVEGADKQDAPYKKILGNYKGKRKEGVLRPYEVLVYEKKQIK